MTKFISLGFVLVAAWSAAPPQPADLLSRMRASIEGYAQLAPSLVAREEYVQNMSDSRGKEERRALVSELLMVRLPGSAGWLTFRDVLSVDKRAVDGRQQRLLELLQSPKPDAMAEARRLAGESARFNVGRIVRTLNLPDMALGYLRAAHAARIRFDTPRDDRINGVQATMVRLEEIAGPTILKDVEGRDLKATGRVWIDSAGAVVRTELNVRHREATGRCVVDFVEHATFGMRVPERMTEHYRTADEEITGAATYSDYRRFAISTSAATAKPGLH